MFITRRSINDNSYAIIAALSLVVITSSLYLVSTTGLHQYFPTLSPSLSHAVIPPDVSEGNNRHLTEAQCNARYPDLYLEADRAEKWYAAKGGITLEMVDKAEEDGGNARLAIIDNILYVKAFNGGINSRTQAVIASVYATLLTCPEPMPDVEFVVQTGDAGGGEWPHFVLDREAEQEALWLMPDFGFFSWPEPGVGSYVDVRRQTLAYETKLGLAFNASDPSSTVSSSWGAKTQKLFWRGSPMVDVRHDLLRASENQPWSDVQDLNWGAINQDEDGRTANHGDIKSPAQHCEYAFLAHVEGWAYSGRLKYLQQCRSVVLIHPLKYIQHFHHLLNGIDDHPDQNVVEVPLPLSDHLGGIMEDLLDESSAPKIQRILDNSWNALRQGYISPAANDCYFRYVLRAYASVQQFRPSIEDRGVSYESFVLTGAVHWDPHR